MFDDGTYGVSVLDMRHGLAPYRGVFSAQGPLHFPLLYVGDLLGFRTIDGPRVAPMLAGIAATIAAWAIARRLAGPTAGLIAGVLVATSGSMIWTTGQVTGDGIAAGARACARCGPRSRTATIRALRRALVTGVADGRGARGETADPPGRDSRRLVAVVAPARRPPRGRGRRRDRGVARVGAAVGSRQRVGPVDRVQQRRRAAVREDLRSSGSSPRRCASRDLLVVGALVLALGAAIVRRGRGPARARRRRAPRRVRRADVAVIAVWAVVTALVLVLEPALYRNHLADDRPAARACSRRSSCARRACSRSLLIILIPWSVANLHDILWPTGYRGASAQLMQHAAAHSRATRR